MPEPICKSEPVPETTPAKVATSERSKASDPLFACTIFEDAAGRPAIANCKVPAAIVVPPL